MMDAETVQLLQELPADLRERGWHLSAAESAESEVLPWESVRYKAVYSRPFDSRLDTEAIQSAAYDPRTRQHVVRVSTLKDCSPSWHDAHQDAIQRMREADARRRRRR